MAFSVIRNGVRLSRKIFDKEAVFSNASYSAKREFSVNKLKTCRCVSLLNELPQKNQAMISREYSKQTRPKPGSKYSSESESDSDLVQLGHRGESEFYRRKIRTFHNIIDVNKDGVLSYHDMELLMERFIALGNISSDHINEFKEIIKEWWVKRWGEISPYTLITVEDYLEYMHHVLNDKELVRRAHSFIPYIFRAIDKDQSGSITLDEYKLFFQCLGLPEKDAILAFRAIDSNGDGIITMKEFVKHGRDFFVTEDENRISKYFWGPLVQ
ncbi:sarcoplasmic calcium-binding protein [Coccinella septempunctata]|uniref:sarcoplasmic calcium-binding protein n=1 Tax=Coccinella septempunctata TaxID=41139 RepID=UPI001D099074|nr:sarcoplasmic calcium-binding protein [Coccinella septempunctata]